MTQNSIPIQEIIKCFCWSFCGNTNNHLPAYLLSGMYRKWMLLGLSWLKEISKLKWGFVSTYFFLFYPCSRISQGQLKAVLTSLWTKKDRAAGRFRRVGDCVGFLLSIACALLLSLGYTVTVQRIWKTERVNPNYFRLWKFPSCASDMLAQCLHGSQFHMCKGCTLLYLLFVAYLLFQMAALYHNLINILLSSSFPTSNFLTSYPPFSLS